MSSCDWYSSAVRTLKGERLSRLLPHCIVLVVVIVVVVVVLLLLLMMMMMMMMMMQVPGTVPPACVMEHWVKDLDQDPYNTAPSKPSIKAAAAPPAAVKEEKKEKEATGGSSTADAISPGPPAVSKDDSKDEKVEVSSASALGENPKQEQEQEEASGAGASNSEQIDAKIAGLKLAAMSEAALLSAEHSVELDDGELPTLQIREGSSGASSASFDAADSNPPSSSAPTDAAKKTEPLSTAPWSEQSSQGDNTAASAEAAERLLQTLQPKKARPSSISRSRDVTKTMTQYTPSRGGGSKGVGTIHQERPKSQQSQSGDFSGDLDEGIEYNL